jgi:tryptophanyl-tRNA synthetase
LDPIREKRVYYENHPEIVREIVMSGSKKANQIGNERIKMIKDAMYLRM